MTTVDFATFCHAGDAHRLHSPGQLRRQVESNGYPFNNIWIVYQLCHPKDYPEIDYLYDKNRTSWIKGVIIDDIDAVLRRFNIDLNRQQYVSPTDKAHSWRNHVVNHLAAVEASQADYIVFADADCWIVRQPNSWVEQAIKHLETNPYCFIVSPNDGEPERLTQVMSQQMFIARTEQFREMDFNQPGWDGDVTKYSEMPEYHAMLEGRMHHYCRHIHKYRYVLGPEYRYWHHNRINPETGHFELDRNKY